jgi:hypothetical protein
MGNLPNKALQPTAATVFGLPGREVSEVAAAAELERSAARARLSSKQRAFRGNIGRQWRFPELLYCRRLGL